MKLTFNQKEIVEALKSTNNIESIMDVSEVDITLTSVKGEMDLESISFTGEKKKYPSGPTYKNHSNKSN